MVKGVRFEVPLKEIFRKPRCAKCDQKMKRVLYSDMHKGVEFNNSHHADWHDDADIKLYRYKYICEKCEGEKAHDKEYFNCG